MRGFWSIAAKEIMHLRRDPATLVIALLIPVIQLTLFGFAIDFDVRYIPTVVVDLDRSRESRAYLDSLQATQNLEIREYLATPEQAQQALKAGSARVGVIIPPDFARRSGSTDRPAVRVVIDGSDNQVATRARLAFMRPSRNPGDPEARIDMLFNPSMRTQVFMIPGLIAVILQIVTVALTSFSLVREREQGTLEQLMVSPVGRLGLMLGKLVPYAGLAMFEMAAVLILGWLVFDVQVSGNLFLLIALTLPFVVAALAMGLLISTIAQNQAQALQMTLLIMMPSILMSGFVFPRDTMPGPLYVLTFALPVTWFLNIVRGVAVRGAGLMDLIPDVFALIVLSVILLTIATTRFRKSMA